MPNVGKSSLINSLKRSRACQVGAVPGVTKYYNFFLILLYLNHNLALFFDILFKMYNVYKII